MGAAASVKEALDFLGSGVSPAYVLKAKIAYGTLVAIDEKGTGRKDPLSGVFDQDVTLKFGRVCGVCAVDGHNALEYTVQVQDSHTEAVRKRFLQPLSLPELVERSIEVGPFCREVAVEVEWLGGAKFLAELIRREKGMYDVRFTGGKREVLSAVPLRHLHPVDEETRTDSSPESSFPDPESPDHAAKAGAEAESPVERRIQQALDSLRPVPPPPPDGERAFASGGFPGRLAPPPPRTPEAPIGGTPGRMQKVH